MKDESGRRVLRAGMVFRAMAGGKFIAETRRARGEKGIGWLLE